jgi:hypothetical protein
LKKVFDTSNTTGLSIETAGSGESIVVVDNAWYMTVGGYPSSTHYARLRYKLPERDGIILTTFYMRVVIVLPPDFYDRQESGLRLMNTDNYGTTLDGVQVGTPGSAEFRTGVYIHKDHSLRIRSDHDHVSVKDFYQSATPLPVGEHTLELFGDVSKDAYWYFKIDGEIVTSGNDTLAADTVPEDERVITRLVAGIDGASSQDTKQVSVYVREFMIADYDVGENVPPPEEPPMMRCVKVTRSKGINLRPTPSTLVPPYSGMSFKADAVFPVQAILENEQGTWAQINEGIYALMSKPNGKINAIEVECK